MSKKKYKIKEDNIKKLKEYLCLGTSEKES